MLSNMIMSYFKIVVQDIAINFLISTGICYSTHLEKIDKAFFKALVTCK